MKRLADIRFGCQVSSLKMFSYTSYLTLLLSLTFLLAFLPSSSSISPHLGYCPRVHGVSNFNMTKFLGKWYEVEGYNFFWENTFACTNEDFYQKEDGSYTKVINFFEKITRKKYSMPGKMRFVKGENVADFVLYPLVTVFTPVPFYWIYPYKLVDTDYTSYAIEYSCRQFGFSNLQQIWVITRNQTYSSELKKRVRDKILSLGLDVTRLRRREQNSCPNDL